MPAPPSEQVDRLLLELVEPVARVAVVEAALQLVELARAASRRSSSRSAGSCSFMFSSAVPLPVGVNGSYVGPSGPGREPATTRLHLAAVLRVLVRAR